jgi:hypothetical protein
MANYCAINRSNLFRVKDDGKFEEFCKKRSLEYWREEVEEVGTCYTIDPDNVGGWPWYDAETDEQFNIYEEIAQHLDDRDVAVLLEVGSEGDRYVRGFARAIHPNGRVLYLDLFDIYERARVAFGKEINISPDSMTTGHWLENSEQ